MKYEKNIQDLYLNENKLKEIHKLTTEFMNFKMTYI